jgi:hypothetical protein
MSAPLGSFGSLDELDAASATAADDAADDQVTPLADAQPFQSQTQPPLITWAPTGANVIGMRGTYVTLNDNLSLSVYNSNTSVGTVTASIRIMTPDGTILTQQLAVEGVQSNRVPQEVTVPLSEGMLIGVGIDCDAATVSRGQCFVNLFLQRNLGSSQPVVEMLISDYITSAYQPSWPSCPLKAPTEPPGYYVVRNGSAGVAGAEVSVSVPSGARWRLIACQTAFSTNGGAGNRNVGLSISTPGNTIWSVSANAAQPDGTSDSHYNWGAAVTWQSADATHQLMSIPPDFFLPAGSTISTNTANMNPLDIYTLMQATVEEWIDA